MIPTPNNFIYLADVSTPANTAPPFMGYSLFSQYWATSYQDAAYFVHNSALNCLMADGHAEGDRGEKVLLAADPIFYGFSEFHTGLTKLPFGP